MTPTIWMKCLMCLRKDCNIRITRQARAHLQDIRDYIATTFLEPGTAKKMVQLLRSEIQSLSDDHLAGWSFFCGKTYHLRGEERIGFRNIDKEYNTNYYINTEFKSINVLIGGCRVYQKNP